MRKGTYTEYHKKGSRTHTVWIKALQYVAGLPQSAPGSEARLDMARILLEKGANPNLCSRKVKSETRDTYGNTETKFGEPLVSTYPLLFAIRKQDEEMVALLLKHGADIEICDALKVAQETANPGIISLLKG